MKNLTTLTIIALILVLPILSAQQDSQIYFKTELLYKDGEISIQSFEPNFYGAPPTEESGDYRIELTDNNNKALKTINFDISLLATDGIILEETTKIIYIPYYKGASELKIYNNENTILETRDLNEYTKTSENKINNFPSNYESLSTENTEGNNTILYIIIGIIILIILIAIIYLIKRKNNPNNI